MNLTRRQFLAGCLVVGFSLSCTRSRSRAAPSRSLSRYPEVDSWLAVLEDGRVQVFTGKLELGQGITIAIAQVAAEELGLTPDQVEVVLADTERTPNEGYSSGSRSVEDSATAVRYAAATAREHLVSLARKRGGDVEVAGGKVGPWTFAELLEGRLIRDRVRPGVQFATTRRVMGQPVPRPDIERMVAGEAFYVQDRRFPGMLHARDLPLTPTGKLDRRALLTRLEAAPHAPEPRPTVRSRFRAPRTGTEQALARVWQEVLKVDRVGLDDNFFDLGGDSILSVQVALTARRAGLDLDLRQLFRYQTVGELAGAMGPRDVAVIEDHEPVVRVPVDRLRALGRAILEEAGLDPEGAAVVAEVQLESSLRNQPTHNICDLPRYARRLVEGVLNSSPHIRVEHETRVSARIDGDNGPGQWVASVAMEKAIEKAGRSGIGLVGVRRSNHFGAAGHYAWMAATRNLIGLCTTNGPLILAPTGGVTPTFGNNPLAVGIPAAERHPVLLDIAMSVAPRGKIGLHVAQGKPLPEGWILDRHGRPSTDLADLAAGLGVPIGAHKGYGLALVMEVLAGALTGAGFGLDHAREKTDFGHFFMALDPELFMPAAEFKARVNVLIEQAKTGRRAVGCEEILVPGEAELRAREENLRLGVPLPVSRYEALMTYARTVGLDGAVPT